MNKEKVKAKLHQLVKEAEIIIDSDDPDAERKLQRLIRRFLILYRRPD